jgi:hypothetical protein
MNSMELRKRRFISVARVAFETDLSDSMIHKLIDEGVLVPVRIKTALRITEESYQNLLATLASEGKLA